VEQIKNKKIFSKIMKHPI